MSVTSPAVFVEPVVTAHRPRVFRRAWLVLLVVGALVVISVVVWWYKGGRYQVFPRKWGVVEQGQVYRSGQLSSRLVGPVLEDHGIDVVLFMSSDNLNREDVRAEIEACKRLGIERYNFPLNGNGTGDPAMYADAVAKIVESMSAEKEVLVHCHTGSQRTSGAVAFFRLLVEKRSGSDVHAEMLSFGHDPDDNEKLIPYLNENMGIVAQMLVDRHVIDRVPDVLPVVQP